MGTRWDRETVWRVAGMVGIVALALIVGYALFVPERTPVAASTPQLVPPSNPVEDPVETEPVVVAFLGDSYTAGAGTSTGEARWVDRLASAEGWSAHNFARGGTGFVNAVDGPTAQVACGLDYCPSFTEMVAEAAAVNPSIVVVSGGRNDANQEPEQAAAGVQEFYDALRAALPDATIIATNVLWDASEPPQTVTAMSDAVRANVERVGGRYLDIGQPLANGPNLISDDGVHPNDAGHEAIANAIRDGL